MSDCPICADALGKPEDAFLHYEPSCTVDRDVNESVFRLSCGHAFHNACLVRHLRKSHDCPSCRRTLADIEEPLDEFILEIDSMGQVNLRNVNVATPEVPWASIGTLNELRVKNKQVQKARRKLNSAKRAYVDMEHRLIQKRARMLRETLQKFRKDEQGT